MNQDVWITRHPYLRPVAEFHEKVETLAAKLPAAFASLPHWQSYVPDFRAGVPLLRSPSSAIDLKPVATQLHSLVEKLAATPLPGKLLEEMQGLQAELGRDARARQRAVEWLLDESGFVTAHVGVLRYIGWTILARYLSTVIEAFGVWREEEYWSRSYCPTCGSLPSMAQLFPGSDPGRLRCLCCGCCGTRWRYRRTACPFCEKDDHHRLASVAIEGEEGLRIDYCESCGSYIKTYNGTGGESVLLADWTSLHLDVIACDRGLHRRAASLYELQ